MMKNSWLNSIALMMSLYCNYAISAEFIYPAVDPNVPNGVLQDLPYRASDYKISYGEDPLQFGELWLPDNTAQRGLVIFVHGGCWSNLYRLDYTRAQAQHSRSLVMRCGQLSIAPQGMTAVAGREHMMT